LGDSTVDHDDDEDDEDPNGDNKAKDDELNHRQRQEKLKPFIAKFFKTWRQEREKSHVDDPQFFNKNTPPKKL